MSEKISGHHLERGAYVYVRQSTPYQVRHHVEGKERQYALADRAKQLGFAKVIVIDDDLEYGQPAASVATAGRTYAKKRLSCRQASETIPPGLIWNGKGGFQVP